MEGQGLDGMVKPRTHSGGFAHNKFLVLSRGGQSSEVCTGSTNLSENGIYGHSNDAHLVRDGAIADKYARYWHILDEDRTKKPTALANEALCRCPRPAPAARSRPSSRRAARSTRSTPTRRAPAAPRARSS